MGLVQYSKECSTLYHVKNSFRPIAVIYEATTDGADFSTELRPVKPIKKLSGKMERSYR